MGDQTPGAAFRKVYNGRHKPSRFIKPPKQKLATSSLKVNGEEADLHPVFLKGNYFNMFARGSGTICPYPFYSDYSGSTGNWVKYAKCQISRY